MKNLKVLCAFVIVVLLGMDAVNAKNVELIGDSEVITLNKGSNGDVADNSIRLTNYLNDKYSEDDASCTVEVKVGFLGLGGKVSATAETCTEAWAMIKELLKKRKE